MHAKVAILLIIAQFSFSWSNPSNFSPQYLYMRLMTDRLQMTDMSFANTGTLASAPDLTSITGQSVIQSHYCTKIIIIFAQLDY